MTLILFSIVSLTPRRNTSDVMQKANRNHYNQCIFIVFIYYNFFLNWMWRDESSTVAPIYFSHTPRVCATSDNRINGFGLSRAVNSLKPFAEILLVMLGIP